MRLRWWLLLSILLAGGSLLLLYYLYTTIEPNPNVILASPQLLFLTVTFFALSASTVPVMAYMNYRFARPGWLNRDKTRLLRQGIWMGLFGVIVIYLQLIRGFSLRLYFN